MYPSVKQQLPEFIKDYLIYCDCFTDLNKQKTCWVLTRNLKFFEFRQKQLVASADLQKTHLSKIKNKIENYNGPKGKWHKTSDQLPPMAEAEETRISFGKYVFCAMNIYKIYVIIKCWDKCVILRKLPDFSGFEIKAEFENVLGYRVVHGTIKYCPVVELNFQDNEILKTDFQDKDDDVRAERDLMNKELNMHQLMERIRCAKTELELHKSITAQSFYSVQNSLTLGQPFLRTFKLEEKQILGRCGDIWKRFTARDDFVIGVPLVNQCSPPNLSIIRNLMPVLQTENSPENTIQLNYRLFQLKLQFDQLDELETLLDCEDEQLQEKIWCANGDMQLLPESFVVLLIKFNISQIISLQEGNLILSYEVIRHLDLASETLNSTFTMPLQLFLQKLDFHKFLFEERAKCEIKFSPLTLHQDFLTIAMTSTETNLKIIFQNCKALDIFEYYIQESLDFSKPTLRPNRQDVGKFNTIFYNENPSSHWFGSLVLRLKELTEDDDNQCVTNWKFYCQNWDKTLFLMKTILNDHLTLQCNIVSISNSDNDKENTQCVLEFENALRQEIVQLLELGRDAKEKNDSARNFKNLEKLYQLQMNSDIIASDMMEN